MKTSLPVLTFIAALWSSALSAADLNIPMAFEYLALDGQQIKKNFIVHQSKLELTPGYHEIAMRYADMVDGEISDTPEKVKSNAFIITLNVTEGADYFLTPAGGGAVRKPWEFAKAPDVVVTRKNGETVDYKLTHTDISDKSFATQLYGQAPQEQKPALVTTNAPTTAAAAAQYTGSSEIVSAPVAASAAVTSDPLEAGDNTATPEQMLRLWWERADENTRKEFLGWAIKQL